MNTLAEKNCEPCTGKTPRLSEDQVRNLLADLSPDWRVVQGHHLERDFKFDNFRQALEFTNRVGELAESEGHHPDIYLAWGKVTITLWTHKIDGLSENDFILAGKIDVLPAR